jgi:hypothetical protein
MRESPPPYSGPPLRTADMGVGANLRGAQLHGQSMAHAYMRKADLSGANLNSASLCGSVLYDADLGGALLMGTILRNADLSGADLSGAEIAGADLTGAVRGPHDPMIPGWRVNADGRLERATATEDTPPPVQSGTFARPGSDDVPEFVRTMMLNMHKRMDDDWCMSGGWIVVRRWTEHNLYTLTAARVVTEDENTQP